MDIAAHLHAPAPLRRDLLIEYLHALQDRHGRLEPEHLRELAGALRMDPDSVFAVAHYCPAFQVGDEAPAGPPIALCSGLACRLAGSHGLAAELAAIGRPAGHAGCMGRCDAAPAAREGQRVLAPARFGAVSAALTGGHLPRPYLGFAAYVDYCAYRAAGGYVTLQHSQDLTAEDLVRALEEAGVPRGREPLAQAWKAARRRGGTRTLAVAVGESAAGDFRDRALIEQDPHRVLEGALIVGLALGVERVVLHVRDVHEACREILAEEIEAVQQELPPVFDLPALELRRGAGVDLAGSATALVEAIEGRCPLPGPQPARSAVVAEVETLFWVREVLELGAARFAGQGCPGHRGRRAVALSGRVNKPGLKLVPAGTPVQEIIERHGGGLPTGQRLGGFHAGTLLDGSLAPLPFDSAALQPHGGSADAGALVVLGERDMPLALA